MADTTPTPTPLDPPTHKLQHTPSSTPYIALPTRSPTQVYLTPLYQTDAPAMSAIHQIPSINRALIGTPVPYTTENATWWITQTLTNHASLPLCALRLTHPSTGPLIGACSLAPHSSAIPSALRPHVPADAPGPKKADLGYYLHPAHRSLGIMRAAVRAVVEWGLETQGLDVVVVRVAEGNEASLGVVGGFGEFRRVDGGEEVVEWPESKGGGRFRVRSYEWRKRV